jgi:ribosome biogenesis GTPase
MYDLATLGFGPFFEAQLSTADTSELVVARVAAEHRGAYEVWASGAGGRAQLAGRLRNELAEAGYPGVGDWVLLRDAPSADQTTVIERVLARRSVFTRAAAGRESRSQVVAANVDLVFAVCGLDGDFSVHRIERYLARIGASGAQPVLVLNKSDLCEELADRLAVVESRCAGVPTHVTSALEAEGLDELRALLHPGMTAALVGSSGAGKSTLINALLGEARMRAGEVRASDGRGCHTTTHRELVVLPAAGLLIDTPGMRELALDDEDGLDTAFADIATLAQGCRFRDCRHTTEPGCAVTAAVRSGTFDADRLEHYRQLEREAEAYELRRDARRRKQAGRVWGQLADEVAQLRRWKGGKP